MDTNYNASKVPRSRLIPARNACLANELIDKGKYDHSGYRLCELNKQQDEQLRPGQRRHGVRIFICVLLLSARAVLVQSWDGHLGYAWTTRLDSFSHVAPGSHSGPCFFLFPSRPGYRYCLLCFHRPSPFLSLLQRPHKHNHGRNEQPRLHKHPRILDRLSGALTAPPRAARDAPVVLVAVRIASPAALFQVPPSIRNRAVGLEPPIGGQHGHPFAERAGKPRREAPCWSRQVDSVCERGKGNTDRDEHPRLAYTPRPRTSVRLLPRGVEPSMLGKSGTG